MSSSSNNETYVCQVFLTTLTKSDEIRCFFANFSASIFYIYKIGYINIFLTSLIIIISIFGKFKENYRWFILNQAVWDLLAANEYNCSNLMLTYIFKNIKPTPSCYFNGLKGSWRFLARFLENCMFANPLTALLLLTASRFTVFYFENFYEKLTKNFRIFYTIIIFNFAVSTIHLLYLFYFLQEVRTTFFTEQCQQFNSTTSGYCNPSKDNLLNFYIKMIEILEAATTLKDILCLFFTAIFAIFLGFRIAKTFLFLKNYQKAFIHSFRITFAIILQIFVALFFFSSNLITFIPEFLRYLGFKVLSSSGLNRSDLEKDPNFCKDCIHFEVPIWMESGGGLKSGPMIQATRQCRVLIDSFIVLFIMTGYREAIVESTKLIFFAIKNPKKAFSNLKSKIVKTKVTVVNHWF